jgi:hypothetical protein
MPLFSTFGGASGRRFGLASSALFKILGGTRSVVTIGGVPYTLFTFTSPGTLSITGGGALSGTVLAVRAGGGGSAPTGPQNAGPGGAGGALIETVREFRAGSHPVVRGENSGVSSIGLPYGTPVASPSGTAGGGGIGAYVVSPSTAGSAGQTNSITGTSVTYGGGGGGGGYATTDFSYPVQPASPGGAGGGGAGGGASRFFDPYGPLGPLIGSPGTWRSTASPGSPGGTNTGGGGGGAGSADGSSTTGGGGGPGIVIVRFRTADVAPL